MASTTPRFLHTYKLRPQKLLTGTERKSMCVGTLGDDEQGIWVSYDRRVESAHPRYWNQAGSIISLKDQMDNIKWAKGLELSRFSAMKGTRAHQPQKEKLKQLFAKRLRAIIRKHLAIVTPPTAALHAALEEAHTDGKNDARRTTPYITWQMDKEQYSTLSGYGDDEGSDKDNEDDEGEEEENGDEGYGEDGEEGHIKERDDDYPANTFAFAETMRPIRANTSLELPQEAKLLHRLVVCGGMNDLLQMKEFFTLIGPSNLAKIEHIKLEIDAQSAFFGYVPIPSHYTGYSGYSTLGVGGRLSLAGNVMCDAIKMMARAGGSLVSFEVSRSRNRLQHSHRFEFVFIDPKRLDSADHTIQYPSYRMFEASGSHGIDSPLGRSIRSLKGVDLICKDVSLWNHGECEKIDQCRVCMQIKGFKIMQKEMLEDSVS
ncbi:hypothetical protein JMJ35_003369 [Cladonia borealis]|uniref:Uncharacterized protein n=1 Tax=Cladonia borealis TaxID=184061 RepID=A0AA39V3Q9_9LECA|nr:hypothetical protein JMJ35_003369 [Cladonia borealis]